MSWAYHTGGLITQVRGGLYYWSGELTLKVGLIYKWAYYTSQVGLLYRSSGCFIQVIFPTRLKF